MSVARFWSTCVAIAMLSMAFLSAQRVQGADVHPPDALEIGKVAPDIEGVDIDGVRFNLSDYRGKVVVIDFWGDW